MDTRAGRAEAVTQMRVQFRAAAIHITNSSAFDSLDEKRVHRVRVKFWNRSLSSPYPYTYRCNVIHPFIGPLVVATMQKFGNTKHRHFQFNRLQVKRDYPQLFIFIL